MTASSANKPASTELTGGAGFSYEDTVVAYYLASLLRRERASGQKGFVTSVAVQRHSHGNPMDDLVVEFDDAGTKKTLSLQVKRSVTISGAASNDEFRGIVTAAAKTQALASFVKEVDACGFAVEHVSDASIRSLTRLIEWAKASTVGADFEARFLPMSTAGTNEQNLRSGLLPLIGAANADEEIAFHQHFVALHLHGLEEGGGLRMEVVNRLQETIASNEDGQDVLLFDRLCRIAREASGNAAKWTRASLLAQLRSAIRLKVVPYLHDDIQRLNAYSLEAPNAVSETIDGFHVEREALQQEVARQLDNHRVVSIGGLPGCGKSAVLKRFAQKPEERPLKKDVVHEGKGRAAPLAADDVVRREGSNVLIRGVFQLPGRDAFSEVANALLGKVDERSLALWNGIGMASWPARAHQAAIRSTSV